MRTVFNFLFIAFFIGFCGNAKAQSGASGANGTYLNYNNFVNGPRTAGGDFEIDPAGYLEIGAEGTMEIFGAMINNGTIEVDSSAVLSIYGDMNNMGKLIIHGGAQVNFYGNKWKNGATAVILDGRASGNTIPGGNLNIIGVRPYVPATWLTAAAHLSAYSSKIGRQYMDGGNVAFDVKMNLLNRYDLALVNTDMKLEGALTWEERGHVILGDQNFTFSKNATQSGFADDRFMVTDGTGHLVKEQFNGKWIFPVGRDTNDYTPAAIDNNTTNTMHVAVQDYDASASVESTPETVEDGMLRTWNIYADMATGVSTFTLQHNSTTNQNDFSSAANYVTRWSDLGANKTGDYASTTAWQDNGPAPSAEGDLSSTGVLPGTEMRERTYRTFATKANDAMAYLTKASLAFRPKMGADIVALKADSLGCETIVAFTTGKENNVVKFQLQHSTDAKTYTTVTTFDPKGDNSTYSYNHLTAREGTNYYRIVMLEPTGDYTISNIASTTVNCTQAEPVVVLYPNPATDFIKIAGLSGATEIAILNMNGRVMTTVKTTNNIESIDLRMLPAAPYVAQVLTGKKLEPVAIKFLKF